MKKLKVLIIIMLIVLFATNPTINDFTYSFIEEGAANSMYLSISEFTENMERITERKNFFILSLYIVRYELPTDITLTNTYYHEDIYLGMATKIFKLK